MLNFKTVHSVTFIILPVPSGWTGCRSEILLGTPGALGLILPTGLSDSITCRDWDSAAVTRAMDSWTWKWTRFKHLADSSAYNRPVVQQRVVMELKYGLPKLPSRAKPWEIAQSWSWTQKKVAMLHAPTPVQILQIWKRAGQQLGYSLWLLQ
jgi:hypothetical protein